MSEPAAESVAALAAAAGMPLSEERCRELAPLYEMLRVSLEHLRSAGLDRLEPVGPGGDPGPRG